MQIHQNSSGNAKHIKGCQIDGHDLQLSHICVFKQCGIQRVGCIKCLELHDHQLEKQSYLEFQDFKQHIQAIVDVQLVNYNHNEEVIKELQKIYSKSQLVKQTLESLQITQMMLLENFKLAENRWDETFLLNQQVINQLVQMDGSPIQKQYQQNSELLSELEKSGTYFHLKEREQKPQEFIMEEKFLKNKKYQFYNRNFFPQLKISPNGAYLAYEVDDQIKIFKINSNKMILNKKLNNHKFNIRFTNDSQFYLDYADGFIYFQALRNCQKRIFGKVQIEARIIMPMNQQEVFINGYDNYFRIINLQSRSIRKIKSLEANDFSNRIIGFEFDQNGLIICGKESKICFYNKNSGSLIFEKEINIIEFEQIKLLRNYNYLICGSDHIHHLYMINYQKKDIYLLNKFKSGHFQYLNNIFHFKYPVMTIYSGIIILDENLKAIQYIKFSQKLPIKTLTSRQQELVCKKNKILLIKCCKQIDYTNKASLDWFIL